MDTVAEIFISEFVNSGEHESETYERFVIDYGDSSVLVENAYIEKFVGSKTLIAHRFKFEEIKNCFEDKIDKSERYLRVVTTEGTILVGSHISNFNELKERLIEIARESPDGSILQNPTIRTLVVSALILGIPLLTAIVYFRYFE